MGFNPLSRGLVGLVLLASSLYAAPGDLDPSFGDGGRKGSDNSFYGFGRPALDAAGRLVVAYGPGLQRLTVAGAFDASWTTTVVPTLVSVAVQSDGNVVALGQAEGPHCSVLAVARFASDGTLDPSFGVGGVVTTEFPGQCFYGQSIAVQPDGKLIAGGSLTSNGFGLARYLPDGSLDSSFGSGALTRTTPPPRAQ